VRTSFGYAKADDERVREEKLKYKCKQAPSAAQRVISLWLASASAEFIFPVNSVSSIFTPY